MSKKFKYVAGMTEDGKPVVQEISVGSGKGQCASGEGNCQEHMTVEQWKTLPNASRIESLNLSDASITGSEDSVSVNEYSGVSVDAIIDEAKTRKGSDLTPEESIVASTLGLWYEEGTLSNSSFGREIEEKINFTNVPTIKKGDKTIGLVEISGSGYKYFYEVEGDEISFRQADGFDAESGKLPFNYGLRKKLTTGEQINSNNAKWAAEAMLGAHGM